MSTPSDLTIGLRAVVAAVVATLANVVIVTATDAAGVAVGLRAVSYQPVIFLTLVGVAGAAVVFAGLTRRSETPERTFVRVAGVVLVVSFVPAVALFVTDTLATVPGIVVLMVMHAIVAAVSVAVLTRGITGVS